jgi:hypothetical protein
MIHRSVSLLFHGCAKVVVGTSRLGGAFAHSRFFRGMGVFVFAYLAAYSSHFIPQYSW